MTKQIIITITAVVITLLMLSCSLEKKNETDEQISIAEPEQNVNTGDSTLNSVTGNTTMNQVSTFPANVILTGLADHRLVSVYKSRKQSGSKANAIVRYSSSDYEEYGDDTYEHYMPGIDILFGYNLLNIAHYDLKTEKSNFLFTHPVLIKTLYYPSYVQDSVDKKPINRNYYLISVYDEDTNKDTLVNNKDLRRFYHFDDTGTTKTQLVPADHSVIRSQYDSKNASCTYSPDMMKIRMARRRGVSQFISSGLV